MENILTIHTRHDANLSLSNGKIITLYLEFEKIAKKRYFAFDTDEETFRDQFNKFAMPFLKNRKISTIALCWVDTGQEKVLKEIFSYVKDWRILNHHISHVESAYMFTDPQEFDLIVSYDGGGDLDDYFKIFAYRNKEAHLLLDTRINLGKPYRLLGLLSPELYKDQNLGYMLDRPLSGKIMALAALGKINSKYELPLQRFYRDFELYPLEKSFRTLLDSIGFKGEDFLPQDEARDLMATSQYVFQENFKRYVFPFLREGVYKRLIVVGGCALNVTMNSITSEIFNLPMFIPPCPNDCGISLGMQKLINPLIMKINTPFFDTPPMNKKFIRKVKFSSRKIGLSQLADLLASGKIIGTFTGPLEIGPRALGNRSYLANPLIHGIKDKLNRIKGREYWRPVAPMIDSSKLNTFFDTTQDSPYMSFASKVNKKYKKLLKEIIHYDGTARIQTVTVKDGWIFKLLEEFARKTGFGILMNTSFNKKGEPLINDYNDAFEILENTDLDGVYMDGVYYGK